MAAKYFRILGFECTEPEPASSTKTLSSSTTIITKVESFDQVSVDDIRKRYFELAKGCHPDKSDDPLDAIRFKEIQEAYTVLMDVEQRNRLEEEEKRNALFKSRTTDTGLEVDLDDMTFDENQHSFSYSCRCGGRFVITEDQLEQGFDAVGCENCSLSIVVLYQKVGAD